MIDYSFKNNSKDTLGFRIYNRYSWRAGAEMIVSVADATSVDTKFQLRKFKKDYTNLHDMVGFIKNLTKVLTDEFPEGSTGLNIRFLEPKKAPVINVEMPSNFMYVGDEMKFTVSTENLERKILAFIAEQDVAKVLKDGRTIKAIGPGKAFLKVGTKEFNRRFDIVVETPPKVSDEKVTVEVPEEVKDNTKGN